MKCVVRMFLPLVVGLFLSAEAQCQRITWRYTGPARLRVDPLFEYYFDNVGFDLLAYAREYARLRAGSTGSVAVFVAAPNVYGWRMRYYVPSRSQWVTVGIDMLAVARWQAARSFGVARMDNWGVYFRSYADPYSWRGAYIYRFL